MRRDDHLLGHPIDEPSRIGKPLLPGLRLVLRGLFAGASRGLAKRTAWSEGRVRATHGA